METTNTPPPSFVRSPLSRRGLVAGAVWSVPAISLASAAPAFAASTISLAPGSAVPPQVARCASVTNLTFAAAVNNVPAPDGAVVSISLPLGLTFTGGGRTADASVRNGVAQVPPFTATGAAGTYAITASYRSATATQVIVVEPAPGSVYEIHRSTGSSTAAATFSSTPVAITNAVGGAILGDQTTMNNNAGPATTSGANAAVLTATGSVRIWGRDLNLATTAPGTLAYNGTTLAGMEFIDVWTSIGSSSTATGGTVASSNAANVYQWYRSGSSGTLVVARVTGISGSVREVTSEDGRSYVRTTNGIYTWVNATTGTGAATVAATLLVSATGLAELSTYGHNGSTTLKWGGSAVSGTTLHTWKNSTTVTQVALPPGVTAVRKVITSDSGLMLLTSTGDLYTRGAATGDATGWTIRTTGVADFSMWGYNDIYIGGLYVDVDGKATRFFGASGWQPTEVMRIGDRTTGTVLTGVTKTYSSDGTYLLLTADGTVYASAGNYDNSGRTGATAVPTGTGTTMDLNVWGHHIGSTYYGGGYVIKGSAC